MYVSSLAKEIEPYDVTNSDSIFHLAISDSSNIFLKNKRENFTVI